jgi:hypothetical protein
MKCWPNISAQTWLAWRDWLDSLFFGIVFFLAIICLTNRASEEIDNYISTRLRRRSQSRLERHVKRLIRNNCEPGDTRKENALFLLWKTLHTYHKDR